MKTKTNGKKWLIGLFGLLFLFLILPVEKVRAADSVELGEWTLVAQEGNIEATDYLWEPNNNTLTIRTGAKNLVLTKKDANNQDQTGKVIIENIIHSGDKKIIFNQISSTNLAIEVKGNSNVKLQFNEVNITSTAAPVLKIEENSTVAMNVVGNNQLKTTGANAVIEKGENGQLIITGDSLDLDAQGICIGRANGSISGIEISCKKLSCQNARIAIGTGNSGKADLKIKGTEIVCSRQDAVIGALGGDTSAILISDNAIVRLGSGGQIKGVKEQRNNWQAMVFDDPIPVSSSHTQTEAKWKIYGNSFTLTKDVEIKDGEKFEEIQAEQTFKVASGATLRLGGENELVNKGKLIIEQGGKIAGGFTNQGTIEGEGSIEPKLTNSIELRDISKTYIGRALTKDDFQKGVDFQYQGDGALDFKWYEDNSGQLGTLLQSAPKDVGIYHVGISAAAGRFYAETAEATKKFEIKKADSQVLLSSSSNPAAVKKELSLTAIVKGVNNEHPTGKVDFEIKKGSTVVKTENNVAVQSGQAVLKWTPEEKGTYSVTAKYKPAADGTGKNYKESTSAEFSLTVNEKGSNPGGNSQGGSSATIIIPEAPKQENKKPEEKKEQDKKEKQKESKKETKSAFKDVKAKDKSYQAIKFAVDKGLLKEKNHKFHPSKKITAKDVVSVLYKLSGKAEDKKASDKKELVKAEAFLKESKILSQKDGDFVKTKEITKERLIQLLYNYAEYKGYNTKVTGKLDALKDSNKLSKSAVKPMKWALENGLITEKNNKLSPKSKVTRKELATILYHFVQKEADWK